MLAEDYEKDVGDRINRLQAIKPVIQAFINDRPEATASASSSSPAALYTLRATHSSIMTGRSRG